MSNNGLVALRTFFSHNAKEVQIAEYTQFYKACSQEERTRFLSEVALWDGKSTFIPLDAQPAVEAAA